MADAKNEYSTGDVGAAAYGIPGEPDGAVEEPASETGLGPGGRSHGGASKGGEAGGRPRKPAGAHTSSPYRLDTNQGDLSTGGAGGTLDAGTGTGATMEDIGREGVDTGVSRR